MGVTLIYNILNNNNKNNPIENIICIINGIVHGIYRVQQGRKQRYHEREIDAGMVLAVQKPGYCKSDTFLN